MQIPELTSAVATQRFYPKRLTLAISTGLLALCLTACGGGSDNGPAQDTDKPNKPDNDNPPAQMTFSQSATWTVDSSKSGLICYDFDSQAEVGCDSQIWDIKFDNQARSVKLWSNSGSSGPGKGGVFGLMDWSDLKTYTNATHDPQSGVDITSHYQADKSASIFNDKPWYEYNLQGRHQLYPNNRVYLVTTDSSDATTASQINKPIFALQIINYYDNAGKSGYPTLRWIDTAMPQQVKTETFDASSYDKWIYVNLKTGKTTAKDGDWHIGFKRMNVILNGGDSGAAKVGGYLAKTPAGFYDDKGKPINSMFIVDNAATTLADLTATNEYQVPADGVPWVVDQKSSNLNPGYTGDFPNLDFGWYTYDGVTHKLSAKPEDKAQGALIRSAEGNSYAKLRLDKIVYDNPDSSQASQWVYHLDIQPAPTS